jgi:hypothetical protein
MQIFGLVRPPAMTLSGKPAVCASHNIYVSTTAACHLIPPAPSFWQERYTAKLTPWYGPSDEIGRRARDGF